MRSARSASGAPFRIREGRGRECAVAAAEVDERPASGGHLDLPDTAEEDDVVGGLDALDDVAVEVREGARDDGAAAEHADAERLEELRRSAERPPAGGGELPLREDADPETSG